MNDSLDQPSQKEELMDAPELDPGIYAAVLRDLARVNVWTFAARPTLSFLSRALEGRDQFRLLDVGSGHGDMLRTIASWARRRGITADLVGIDLNPESKAIARSATPSSLGIEYRTGDYTDHLDEGYDFIISSLVAHHMTATQLADFLRNMEQHTRIGWLINDLHRHRVAYALFPLLAKILRVHPIVRHDGQLSIARSLRPSEWSQRLGDVDLDSESIRIVRYFPFRLCVEHIR